VTEPPGTAQGVESKPRLARQLGTFDVTMLVMGGIVGAGIFVNPSVVAQQVHTPALILGAWIFGGLVGLTGAFIWAELAATLPAVGGQYAYLREAFHPAVAFLYGWVLLLVIQTGGMAAVSITFARYFLELTSLHTPDWLVATVALGTLTLINCLGVKAGGRTQSALMVMKILAIAALRFIRWRHGARVVRVRRMADRELRCRGGERPKEEFATRTAARSNGRGYSLFDSELGMCAIARAAGAGGHSYPSHRSNATGIWPERSEIHCGGNCYLDPGVS